MFEIRRIYVTKCSVGTVVYNVFQSLVALSWLFANYVGLNIQVK